MPEIRLKYSGGFYAAGSSRGKPLRDGRRAKQRRGSKMKAPGIQTGQWEQRRTGRMRHTTIFFAGTEKKGNREAERLKCYNKREAAARLAAPRNKDALDISIGIFKKRQYQGRK